MMPARFLEPDSWGPGYVYETPRIKASSLYQDAVDFEEQLAARHRRLFTGPCPDVALWLRAAQLWDRAGFFGWASNYRDAAARVTP